MRIVKNTYASGDPTDPRRPSVPSQCPNTITEVPLHDERNDCRKDGNVYGAKMGILEVFHLPESSNKPIMDISPNQGSLNGLQQEDDINCSRLALTSQSS